MDEGVKEMSSWRDGRRSENLSAGCAPAGRWSNDELKMFWNCHSAGEVRECIRKVILEGCHDRCGAKMQILHLSELSVEEVLKIHLLILCIKECGAKGSNLALLDM